MPQILVRDLDTATIERLKARARLSRRSLQQEVKVILHRAARALTPEQARRLSHAWHRRLAGRKFSDTAAEVRSDRDSR